jgi:nuclear transcription Y subunit beta
MENEQDKYLLPTENIKRIIKEAFPEDINCKLTKEGKEAFQEILSEFISFVTSEASEKAAEEGRKTVLGTDIISALETLGFEHYTDILKQYLGKIKQNSEYKP